MLKRLEIQGFKSFADKIKMEFTPGLTVIVGPNGSGKSNIADAISWVLGEQRATALRGRRMDDIIFAGSDKRRSVGMCEVSLTLDNSKKIFPLEYSEITITRRIFRSGESQFMINKVSCRLKDIHSLLMDTGIGQGAYSIIGQGKVDEILHSRPEERRLVIEEAAGIVKYRQRKEESLRKLANTEQDLLRLGDIITELQSRLEPLAKEAEKAHHWRELEQQNQQLELGLLAWKMANVKEKLSTLGEQLRELDHGAQKIDNEVAKTVLHLESQLAAKDGQLEEQREILENVRSEIQLRQQQLMLAQEKQNNCLAEIERVNHQKSAITTQIQTLAGEIEQQEKKLAESKEMLAPKRISITQLQQQWQCLEKSIEEHEMLLEQNKAQVIELMNDAAHGRNKLQRAEERKKAVEYRLSQLRRSAQDAALEQGRLREKIKEVRKETQHIKDNLTAGQQKLVVAEKERQQLIKQLQIVKEQVRRNQEQLLAAKSKYRLLQETEENYTGYQRGVRGILLALKKGDLNIKGICGPVADVIQVPVELEVAIETALGGALQNLVTKTDTAAKGAIEYLKRNKWGRVTFLPLNTLRPTPRHAMEKKALKMPGIIGVGADLVKYDSQYQVAVEFLLGKVLVAENINYALEAARVNNQRLRLVTLEGECIYPGGSLSGGSANFKSGGLLKAKREKVEWAQKIVSGQKNEKKLLSGENKLNEDLVILEQRIEYLREELVKNQVALAGKEQELVQLEDAVAKYRYRSQENNYEINNLLNEIKQHDQVQVVAARKVAEAEGKLKQVQVQIEERQTNLTKLKEQGRNIEQHITSLKVEVAGVGQQQEGVINLLRRLNQEHSHLHKELSSLDGENITLERKQQHLLKKITSLTEQLEALHVQQQENKQVMKKAKEEQQLLQQQLASGREKMQQVEQEQRRYVAQVHKLQLQQARQETEKQVLLEKMEQDFNISRDTELPAPVDNPQSTKKKINEIKNILAEMGPVNPNAEEEHAQVQARYNYLQKQKQDLDESKYSLQQLIAEMDALMAKKFTSTFKRVAQEFVNIFNQLFGGGYASLKLVGEHPLTAGIEIEARPPGKKLQNISLLSGGERSLTAIALLFAILRVKPSPFCVLDEIDAALDETNVERFAQFLQKISVNEPFVVISHRKGTMEKAAAIYGVTMGSTGTSKIFSIELPEAEAAIAQA